MCQSKCVSVMADRVGTTATSYGPHKQPNQNKPHNISTFLVWNRQHMQLIFVPQQLYEYIWHNKNMSF